MTNVSDVVGMVLAIFIGLLLMAFLLYLFFFPIITAKAMALSKAKISIVWVLTWLGLISMGLTWLIAVILVYCSKDNREELE